MNFVEDINLENILKFDGEDNDERSIEYIVELNPDNSDQQHDKHCDLPLISDRETSTSMICTVANFQDHFLK